MTTKAAYRLAAIDMDGTLLGPHQQISEANALAVRRLQEAGVHVVLASGRHYRSIRPYADALPGVEWIVSCQGGEVANVDRTTVLERRFLAAREARQALEGARALGFSTVFYTPEGVFTNGDWDAELGFYAALAGRRPEKIDHRATANGGVFKVLWMGEPAAISEVCARPDRAPANTQMVRTHARLVEFMPADVSKGTALAVLAARLGIRPEDAVVFGDGDNDVPMFDWAGMSVAMPHGWPAAVAKARLVAPAGPEETALARAVHLILDGSFGENLTEEKMLFGQE
jgi:hypothetical protein